MINGNFTNISGICNVSLFTASLQEASSFLLQSLCVYSLATSVPVVSMDTAIYLTVPGIVLHKGRLRFAFA